ncbi:PA2169 family four-helix-bundle protein [Aquabacterium sp. A7-Y]|uniref:PA2169 family four-helix-bundle protein n=1 Tax=Aquabacterium sp. A7-Y TaxID=1349605 RepID=UPI00223D95DD|nr:PA2169 family four-helix-bundle protein [Aquabacterium sp. A7-Y]MCW7540245.1 PA2169 family four-helix-bundle protein [Aquabacterium sp. A7-Y]
MNNDDVIGVLNDLVETSKDGEYGFTSCAEHAKSPELKSFFTARAGECRRGAEELQAQVALLGGKPDTSGTAAGAVHRGWVAVRGVLSGYDDHSMLEECERGEDVAVTKYRAALEKPLPPDLRAIVERQLQGAQRNHNEVKALRDRFPRKA